MAGRRRGKRGVTRRVKGGGGVAAATRVSETSAQAGITAIKTRIAELNRRDAEALAQIERGREQIEREQRVRDEVAVEMTQATAELEALVTAPVPTGLDPTAWLPDELLILILLQVGWGGGCEAVCRRWHGLCQDVALKRQLREGRWEEYAAGRLRPRTLHGHCGYITSLATGPNDELYSGSGDAMVRVWSTRDGQLLRTLEGHTESVYSLAVAQDGTLYSGSADDTVRVWSGETGIHLRTLTGHTDAIFAVAIGANGNVFSGSCDQTIRAWSGRDGTHLHTLVGHTSHVNVLAASRDKLYSGSPDTTIRVWSATDGAHLQTLTGHTFGVYALAFGPDGNLFSGSQDGTVREWCRKDGTHLRTLQCATDGESIAVGRDDGRLFITDTIGRVLVWRSMGASRCIALSSDTTNASAPMCRSAAGTLYTGFTTVPGDHYDESDEDSEPPTNTVIRVW